MSQPDAARLASAPAPVLDMSTRFRHYRRLLLGFVSTLAMLLLEGHSVSTARVAATYTLLFGRYLVLTKLFRRQVRSERIFGFDVAFADHGAFFLLFEEIFVKEAYLVSAIHAPRRIIDAGANIGMAVLYMKWKYPDSVILAFEPHLETFGLLERNVRHNRLEDVTLFQVALGASTGSAAFYTEGAGSLVGNTIAPRGNAKVETARVVPLSQYVAGGVDLLKLDVEGAEGAVIDDLESAGKLPAIRSLVLEYHHNLASQSTPLSRILAQLESAGFTYVLLSAHSGLWGVQRFQDVSIVAERH